MNTPTVHSLLLAYVRVRPGVSASTVFRAGLGPFRRHWQQVCVDAGQLGELRMCDRLDVETDDPFAGKPSVSPKPAAKRGKKTVKNQKSPETA